MRKSLCARHATFSCSLHLPKELASATKNGDNPTEAIPLATSAALCRLELTVLSPYFLAYFLRLAPASTTYMRGWNWLSLSLASINASATSSAMQVTFSPMR